MSKVMVELDSDSKMTLPVPAWMSSLKTISKTGRHEVPVSWCTGVTETIVGDVESPMVWMSRFVPNN